jgi:hypothetical protein
MIRLLSFPFLFMIIFWQQAHCQMVVTVTDPSKTADAHAYKTPKNVIKTNVLGIVNGNYTLAFERKLTDNWSLEGIVGSRSRYGVFADELRGLMLLPSNGQINRNGSFFEIATIFNIDDYFWGDFLNFGFSYSGHWWPYNSSQPESRYVSRALSFFYRGEYELSDHWYLSSDIGFYGHLFRDQQNVTGAGFSIRFFVNLGYAF